MGQNRVNCPVFYGFATPTFAASYHEGLHPIHIFCTLSNQSGIFPQGNHSLCPQKTLNTPKILLIQVIKNN